MTRLLLLLLFASPVLGQTSVSSGGTKVIGAPGASSVAAVTCTGGKVLSAISAAGVATCVTAPAATVTSTSLQGLSPSFSALTAAQVNNTYVADQAATGAGGNALANLASGPCATATPTNNLMCDLMISPLYTNEFSRYFNTAQNRDDVLYQAFPFAGGMKRTRAALDRRQGNLFFSAINTQPIDPTGQYDNRTPVAFESRMSTRLGYADNDGVVYLGQFLAGAGYNYYFSWAAEKTNHTMLTLNSDVRSAAQGGGSIGNYLNKTAPGDDMVFSVQHDTNGCSESEDECNKLYRSFLETGTQRFGGVLSTAPALDTNNFGLYAFHVTPTGGYSTKRAGEGVLLVNLSKAYSTGNIASITYSTAYPGLLKVTGDSAAGWASRYGASAITTLTAPIDAKTYDANCPSTVLNAAARVPDPSITDEWGVGGFPAFCATVASTAGFTDGEPISLGATKSNIEDARVVHVVDATHMTLNVQLYHDTGEYITGGGAQGYALRTAYDDIAIGGLVGYYDQPKTVLHKFWKIFASDSSGALYLYYNGVRGSDMSTMGYTNNTPNKVPVISATLTGTAVTAINLVGTADLRTGQTGVVTQGAQSILAAPALTFAPCSQQPTYTSTVTYNGGLGGMIPTYTPTSGGNCTGPVTVTVQSIYPIPYSITPAVVTKKVVDPSTGIINGGYVMTGTITPANWSSGDIVEMPGWIRDATGSMEVYGRYFTAQFAGLAVGKFFNGDWASQPGSPGSLDGILNNTDGHKYYATPTQPVGPGVAYETPPDGYTEYGDVYNGVRLAVPPMNALLDVDCAHVQYHPCQDGVLTPYLLFNHHGAGVASTIQYDPSTGTFTFSGPFAAPSLTVGGVSVTGGSSGSAELAVAYSSTPVLNPTYKLNTIALTGPMSPTIAAGTANQAKVCLRFVKSSTSATYVITYPTNLVGGGQPLSGYLYAKQCYDWTPSASRFETDGPMMNF